MMSELVPLDVFLEERRKVVELVSLDTFMSINKKGRELSTRQQNVLSKYLSEAAKPIQSRDIISNTKLGKIYTPKKLTTIMKREPEIEREDGSVEIIEVVDDSTPLLFVLKRNVCERNCRNCEENDRCIESDWIEEESLKTNSLL